ncbi:hypothetical protein Taro_029331 [Colocasia esculenta]|uniref:Uncharacterized protein n=1 Tax=Colocasia esculenta TaxID=4460 RepID=A0A843VDJ9_COLES|nr:hypothetical protein [Colocasia esculenta]
MYWFPTQLISPPPALPWKPPSLLLSKPSKPPSLLPSKPPSLPGGPSLVAGDTFTLRTEASPSSSYYGSFHQRPLENSHGIDSIANIRSCFCDKSWLQSGR